MLLWPVAMLPIKFLGPLGAGNALARKLSKRLAGEARASVPHTDAVRLAAAHMHGGDAAVARHFAGRMVAIPACTECGNQPRHGGVAGSGKGREDRRVGMNRDQLVAAPFHLSDL